MGMPMDYWENTTCPLAKKAVHWSRRTNVSLIGNKIKS
jgi:hypothetical protein